MSNLEISRAERLDQYVIRQLPSLSRGYASRLIAEGKVTVNGEPQHKAGYKLRATDEVTIDYDDTKELQIADIELPVIYEDKDCVVINKPVGLLTHSKGPFNPEPTVESWLRSRLDPKAMSGERAGIVHRLDRATSGVMICAKTPEALSWLQKQFSQRKVKKTYSAVVQGVLKQPKAIIDMPIERNPKKPQTFRVGSNGKTATTAYKVTASDGVYSLVELTPTTGRTHQLRVHLEHLGHPILGDTFYGGKTAERLFLHAHSLEITLPNRQRQTFTVPVPPLFEEQVKA
jgi:23S rRNA pseudouridine1911/1915/1917 synthase